MLTLNLKIRCLYRKACLQEKREFVCNFPKEGEETTIDSLNSNQESTIEGNSDIVENMEEIQEYYKKEEDVNINVN